MLDASRFRQLMVFALLALLSYAVWEYSFNDKSEARYKPFTKGYSLTEVLLEITDLQGNITTTITSPSVVHYADSLITEIEKPHVLLKDKNGGEWVFDSSKGVYSDDAFELYFPDQVVVSGQSNQQQLSLETSSLTVNTNTKIAYSDAAIEIKQKGMLINGLGSYIDFPNQEIEVKKDVHAEF